MASSRHVLLVVGCFVGRCVCWRDTHDIMDTDKDDFHGGPSIAHVTRLNRYDHTGLEAMIEAESIWRRRFQEPEASRAQPVSPRFVQLSAQQTKWLQGHHREKASEQDTESELQKKESVLESSEAGTKRKHTRPGSSEIRKHNLALRRQAGAGFVATGLSSLGSQYVGPIGVGTVKVDCDDDDDDQGEGATSLLYISRAANQRSPESRCHAEEQAEVWVVFDTGSTNLWVASDLCTSGACVLEHRERFDHTLSQTFAWPQDQVSLQVEFGTGTVVGPQGVDALHLGAFTIENQTFGLIEELKGDVFAQVPFEGILGLGFPDMSANGVQPVFDNLIEKGKLPNNTFAFYFSPSNTAANAVFWGGVDDTFYHGPVEYFNVVDPFYWSLELVSMHIGDQELDISRGTGIMPKAIVDTGTTYFTAESGVFETILDMLPTLHCNDLSTESHAPVTFKLRRVDGTERDFVFNFTEFMAEDQYGICSPTFMKINLPSEHGPGIILGAVFLRQFFSVFDRGATGSKDPPRVGFALSAEGEAVESHLWELTKDQVAFNAVRASSLLAANATEQVDDTATA